jgi:hypothetical protein
MAALESPREEATSSIDVLAKPRRLLGGHDYNDISLSTAAHNSARFPIGPIERVVSGS